MARVKKKDNIKFSSLIDKALYEKMKEYSDETGIPITVIIDKAIRKYFEEIESK